MSKRFDKLRVPTDGDFKLSKRDPRDDLGLDREDCESHLEENRERMAELHEKLWASRAYGLLVVLQGMDTCGKDGTVRHVLTGLNPQGCTVTSFKIPTAREADHDYLWRVHSAVPGRGDIGVFNRSHYEDVIVTRVLGTVSKKDAERRFEEINAFEKQLVNDRIIVLKFFLNISRAEQKERLEARLEDPRKNWKFSEHDLEARAKWDDYQGYYQDMLRACSTKHAPWYVIPADRKWVRNIIVSQVIADTLASLKMSWPKPEVDLSKVKIPD